MIGSQAEQFSESDLLRNHWRKLESDAQAPLKCTRSTEGEST